VPSASDVTQRSAAMRRITRTTFLLLTMLVGLFLAELLREYVQYRTTETRLGSVSGRLHPGMTVKEVLDIAKEPDFKTNHGVEDLWYWDASEHQGELRKVLHLMLTKGHYALSVRFEGGVVTDIWAGVN